MAKLSFRGKGIGVELEELPKSSIRGIFTDLDGTLTEHSAISPQTFQALASAKERGFWVVIVSGRPAGWADCLTRLWPIDAMIFENGAGVMFRGEDDRVKTVYLASEKNLEDQRKQLRAAFDRLTQKIPHLKLAADQPYRLFDFAIDYAEEPPYLRPEEVRYVVDELRKETELTVKLSSIHVNYWYGKHTKVTACEYLLREEGPRRGIDRENVVYCGDSPNDEPLFSFFPITVGVANVRPFLPQMKAHPKYFTQSSGGNGFQELVKVSL